MQPFSMICGGQVVGGSSRQTENNFGTDPHLENLACQFTGPYMVLCQTQPSPRNRFPHEEVMCVFLNVYK